jgi:dTDP-4-dehydrorhamnose 3,5-epimerase
MSLQELSIAGAFLAIHEVFTDERGIFREWFKAEEIASVDPLFEVRQANYSKSNQWVIRGIHYSIFPQGQAKIVTCASGRIIDVLVDLREGSPTFLNVHRVELSEDSGKVVYIPTGVGHGYIVESDSAAVTYLTSSSYSPKYEKAICPTDPELRINWPIPMGEYGIISKTDTGAPTLAQARESGALPTF